MYCTWWDSYWLVCTYFAMMLLPLLLHKGLLAPAFVAGHTCGSRREHRATIMSANSCGLHRCYPPAIGGLQDVHRVQAIQAGVVVVWDQLRQMRWIPALHCHSTCVVQMSRSQLCETPLSDFRASPKDEAVHAIHSQGELSGTPADPLARHC